MQSIDDLFQRLEQLNEIGAALSQVKNLDLLLEKILLAAQTITRADGGTLYLLEDGSRLKFAIMRNESLGIAMGGTTGNPIPFYPVQLYGKDGAPNNQMVAARAALTASISRMPIRKRDSISQGREILTRKRATGRDHS